MKDLYLLLHLSVDEVRCTCRQDERTGCSGREAMAPTCVPRSETSLKDGYLEISSHGLHSSAQKEGKGNVITPEHLLASSRSFKMYGVQSALKSTCLSPYHSQAKRISPQGLLRSALAANPDINWVPPSFPATPKTGPSWVQGAA